MDAVDAVAFTAIVTDTAATSGEKDLQDSSSLLSSPFGDDDDDDDDNDDEAFRKIELTRA